MSSEGFFRFAESLGWSGATRNDKFVANSLFERKTPDGVYTLDASTIADDFFHWIDIHHIFDGIRSLQGEGIQRESIPYETLIMTYVLRTLCRVKSMNSLNSVLFADRSLMLRLGYNAHQIETGLTQRGHDRQGERVNMPIDPEMLSKNIVKLNSDELRRELESALKLIWNAQPERPSRVAGIIDGTFVEPGPSTKGGTWSTQTERVKTKEGWIEKKEHHYGFKLVWMMELHTGLPLSFAFTSANEDERKAVQHLIDGAQRVLGERSTLDTLLIDRGYFSGSCLYEIARRGLRFVTPAKKNTNIWKEAHQAARAKNPGLPLYPASRCEERRRRNPEGGPLITKTGEISVMGIEGLCTFETYDCEDNLVGGRHKDTFKKDFVPNSINAVVLTSHTDYHEPALVLLTNGPVTAPLTVFDDYDDRSLIENKGNRTLKQDWHLNKPPQRNSKATEIHCYFVILSFACAIGHMLYLDRQQQLIDRGKPSTLGDYQRQVSNSNRDHVIVFYGNSYGILFASELLLLLGLDTINPNKGAALTIDELFKRIDLEKG